MTWYWLYKSLPELAGLPEQEKRRLWERCMFKGLRAPVVWVAMAVQAAAMMAVPRLVSPWWLDPTPVWFVVGLVCCGVVGGGGVALVNVAMLHAVRPYLLRELPSRCRGCGYDLTGNASGTCPECGRPTKGAP